jgi:hypothetical protein
MTGNTAIICYPGSNGDSTVFLDRLAKKSNRLSS